ncbi:hypothetical protein [Paenibacillus glycanilyticus]|uniref:Uncharacterized protein n=1 Tax=Paenibacillus glycanilyticus TaxID=126569 RepID=A0ABQ6G4C8_9BACL|nr:hypothetical protein [Paenibacillus glycanilyticus]GLX65803.1 hypothetical protein MU1_01470 [Paenibacillus glycanilyticus]
MPHASESPQLELSVTPALLELEQGSGEASCIQVRNTGKLDTDRTIINVQIPQGLIAIPLSGSGLVHTLPSGDKEILFELGPLLPLQNAVACLRIMALANDVPQTHTLPVRVGYAFRLSDLQRDGVVEGEPIAVQVVMDREK